MTVFLKFWIAFLFVSITVGTLTLSAMQTRLIAREGWRVFRARKFLDLYWRELSPLERILIWPGIAAFFLTMLAGTLSGWFFHAWPRYP